MTETLSSAPSAGGPLKKAFELLETIAQAPGPTSLSSITRQSGKPKSSVHRMLRILLDLDLVTRVQDGYVLGSYLGDLTRDSARSRAERLRRVLNPYLVELRDATGGIVITAVLSGPDVEIVDTFYTRHWAPLVLRSPVTAPAHCTAVGRALLAHRPDAVSLLEEHFPQRHTERTRTCVVDLARQFEVTRNRGVALVDSEYLPDTTAIGAPLLTGDQHPFMAIGVWAPKGRIDVTRAMNAVFRTAEAIRVDLTSDRTPMTAC
ncbi:IclR family transcriptional regulator [Actinokineospora sp. PR83]|uniref:IclR family transcriptional regulator n=1 Tax=Actinokineospora sp. PR83 TaxID=2884908 RepID=UPI001F2AC925|nr:IclR family transcriptional regulator [Actinokineospora sp. PR83]MCG8917159.1 IclR family transcriptional regulator [Actinokineospora sp. PR83]